jgi:hypothetical protein
LRSGFRDQVADRSFRPVRGAGRLAWNATRTIDSAQTIARRFEANVPPRTGADGPQGARGARPEMVSQRQRVPMKRGPPGRLNSGIEMRTGARYWALPRHFRSMPGVAPLMKVHVTR